MNFKYKRLVLDLNKMKDPFYTSGAPLEDRTNCFIIVNVEKYNPVLNKNIYFAHYDNKYMTVNNNLTYGLSSHTQQTISRYSLKQAELEDKFLVLK